MISATADTNILISGLTFKGGNSNRLLELARAGAIRLSVSYAILAEMADVLARKFGWPEEDVFEAKRQLIGFTQTVKPTETLDLVKADADDNRIWECAAAAHSDYIISGDRHLLLLGRFRDVPIVKVADFLELVNRSL